MQLELHYVLKKLIRVHFRDDLEKTKELLTMITKTIHPDLLSEIPIIKKAMMEIKEKDEIIQRQAAEIEKLKKNKKMD